MGTRDFMLRTPAQSPYRLPSVRLSAEEAGTSTDNAVPDPTRARWVQVAYTGKFKGHWQGEFEFTEATFNQVVANFRKHPAYKAGATTASAETIANGDYDVVQYDFEHASEQNPTEGDIPAIGVPAQGWVMELEVRKGSDGKSQLWAFSRFLEPAATYLAEKKYRWTSVAILFDAHDPVTGKATGARLTSIAITNHPFLQALPAIAASSVAPVRLGGYYGGKYYECIDSPEDAFEAIRGCLGMASTASVPEVAAEVAKLKTWTAPGATPPPGVEVDEHIANFRSILALPVLSTADEVFAELDKLFARLSAPPTNESAPAGATVTTTAAQRHEDKMTTPAQNSQPDALVLLTETYARKLSLKKEDLGVSKILTLAEQGADAMADLASLLEALGAKGIREALAKVAEAKGIADKFAALMPQYEQMKARVDEMDAAEAEADVGMAMTTLGFKIDDPAKQNLRRTLTKERKADKDGFRKEYGITTEARQLAAAVAERAHLTTPIATSANAGLTGPLASLTLGGGGNHAPALPDKPVSGAVDITSFAGPNIYAKAENYVRSLSNAPRDYDSIHLAARELVNARKVFVASAN